MQKIALPLLFVLTLLAGQALAQAAQPAPAIAPQEKPVVDAATAWLGLIDAGDYPAAWRQASAFFRRAVTLDKWKQTMAKLRAPLGRLVSRTPATAARFSSLPGVPDGRYVVMTFTTAFANKKAAIETVTFMQDPDGAWRAAGYFIK